MSLLEDTALFAAVIEQNSFSGAAKKLGLSNGLVSRRIAKLEAKLGVTLMQRTTRQFQLTAEGELLWKHAQRIQQEFNSALSLIQAVASKPKGSIRISAPLYFGRHYLTPILINFLKEFPDIEVDLVLTNKRLDLIKDKIDLVIRGAGYLSSNTLPDSDLKMRLLQQEKINLYASPTYLLKYGEPKSLRDLSKHAMIYYVDDTAPTNQIDSQLTAPCNFKVNDIESALLACQAGHGLALFTTSNAKSFLEQNLLKIISLDHDWGEYFLYILYPKQQKIPKRTKLLLDYVSSQFK